jgi:hypothetical protein
MERRSYAIWVFKGLYLVGMFVLRVAIRELWRDARFRIFHRMRWAVLMYLDVTARKRFLLHRRGPTTIHTLPGSHQHPADPVIP